MAIDETAALKAASWGLTQILGENCTAFRLQHASGHGARFMDDEENHLKATVALLKHMGIADDLKAHAWAVVARVWNGPGYKKNKYDTKMAAAYAKWAKIKDTASVSRSGGALCNGCPHRQHHDPRRPGEASRSRLYRGGTPDGKTGKLTKTAILAFPNENDLPVADVIDEDLLNALDDATSRDLPRNDGAPAQVRAVIPEVQSNFITKVGAGGVAGTLGVSSLADLASRADSLRGWISPWKDMFSHIPGWVWLGGAAVIIGGIALIAWHGERKGVQAFQEGARR